MKEEAKKSEDSSDVKIRRKTKWKTIRDDWDSIIPSFQIRLEI